MDFIETIEKQHNHIKEISSILRSAFGDISVEESEVMGELSLTSLIHDSLMQELNRRCVDLAQAHLREMTEEELLTLAKRLQGMLIKSKARVDKFKEKEDRLRELGNLGSRLKI